jgi:hypothetical protein
MSKISEAREAAQELESLFEDRIASLYSARKSCEARQDPNNVAMVNVRHTYLYYRSLLWQIREGLKR